MEKLLKKLKGYTNVDGAADKMGKNFIHDSLPPYLVKDEKVCSVYNGAEKWCKKKECVINEVQLSGKTPIRLIRKNCLR